MKSTWSYLSLRTWLFVFLLVTWGYGSFRSVRVTFYEEFGNYSKAWRISRLALVIKIYISYDFLPLPRASVMDWPQSHLLKSLKFKCIILWKWWTGLLFLFPWNWHTQRQTQLKRITSSSLASSLIMCFRHINPLTICRYGALALFLFMVKELYTVQADVCFHNLLPGVTAECFYRPACFISINTVSMMLTFSFQLQSGIIPASQMEDCRSVCAHPWVRTRWCILVCNCAPVVQNLFVFLRIRVWAFCTCERVFVCHPQRTVALCEGVIVQPRPCKLSDGERCGISKGHAFQAYPVYYKPCNTHQGCCSAPPCPSSSRREKLPF